jgi:hypothetical protein
MLDELLSDLRVSNPEYRSAFDVGSNPVIETLTKVVDHVPTYYALPTTRGVTFDMKKLEDLRETLITMKNEAVETANQVIRFEFERLKAEGQIQFEFIQDKYLLSFNGEQWRGSAEHIIQSTMNITEELHPAELWKIITKANR